MYLRGNTILKQFWSHCEAIAWAVVELSRDKVAHNEFSESGDTGHGRTLHSKVIYREALHSGRPCVGTL